LKRQRSAKTVSHATNGSSKTIKSVANSSRDVSLARREALSRRGKIADTSNDRTRVDVVKASNALQPNETQHNNTSQASIQRKDKIESAISPKTKKLSKKRNDRRALAKRKPIENTSRAFALARRESLSKHGKSAGKQPASAASVARQGNPDLTTREIAQRVRDLRSKSGATGNNRSSVTRPCGPNRHGAKQSVSSTDAHWKVGTSETNSGQVVTGTQANRSVKTTGNEASTCRSITGTQYLGSEVYSTFCEPSFSNKQPLKVAVTKTSHGNRVTGNEVGRSGKVTGDEPGTCKALTGTEYISANQSQEYCGGVNPSPRKVGQSQTLEGRKVTGVMVGRSPQVTGDEAGSDKALTGDQYLGSDPLPFGRPAQKVASLGTLKGNNVTGTDVSRASSVTGNEQGSCKNITGDEYIGANQYQSFCGNKPAPEAAKVGLSITNNSQGISGSLTGRSSLVTGDEAGTCKAVTGTPYAGLDQAAELCDSKSYKNIKSRTPARMATPARNLTGLQPGVGGVMTGADKGACETLTGTPYIGMDHIDEACGSNFASKESENSSDLSPSAAWTDFSIQSPARAAQMAREKNSSVTGTSYENTSRITGPFDMATNKVTGTEQFRFDNKKKRLVIC